MKNKSLHFAKTGAGLQSASGHKTEEALSKGGSLSGGSLNGGAYEKQLKSSQSAKQSGVTRDQTSLSPHWPGDGNHAQTHTLPRRGPASPLRGHPPIRASSPPTSTSTSPQKTHLISSEKGHLLWSAPSRGSNQSPTEQQRGSHPKPPSPESQKRLSSPSPQIRKHHLPMSQSHYSFHQTHVSPGGSRSQTPTRQHAGTGTPPRRSVQERGAASTHPQQQQQQQQHHHHSHTSSLSAAQRSKQESTPRNTPRRSHGNGITHANATDKYGSWHGSTPSRQQPERKEPQRIDSQSPPRFGGQPSTPRQQSQTLETSRAATSPGNYKRTSSVRSLFQDVRTRGSLVSVPMTSRSSLLDLAPRSTLLENSLRTGGTLLAHTSRAEDDEVGTRRSLQGNGLGARSTGSLLGNMVTSRSSFLADQLSAGTSDHTQSSRCPGQSKSAQSKSPQSKSAHASGHKFRVQSPKERHAAERSERALRRRKKPLTSREVPVNFYPNKAICHRVNMDYEHGYSCIRILEPFDIESPDEATALPFPIPSVQRAPTPKCTRATDGDQMRDVFVGSSPAASERGEDFHVATYVESLQKSLLPSPTVRRASTPKCTRATDGANMREAFAASNPLAAEGVGECHGVTYAETSQTPPLPSPAFRRASTPKCTRATDGADMKEIFATSSPLAAEGAEECNSATYAESLQNIRPAGAKTRSGRYPRPDDFGDGLIDLEDSRWCHMRQNASRRLSSDLVKCVFDEDEHMKGSMQRALSEEELSWSTSTGRKKKFTTRQTLSVNGSVSTISLPMLEAQTFDDGADEASGYRRLRKSVQLDTGDEDIDILSEETGEPLDLPLVAPRLLKVNQQMHGEKMFDHKGKVDSRPPDHFSSTKWDDWNFAALESRATSAPPPMECGWNPVTNEFGKTLRGKPRLSAFAAEGENGPALSRHTVQGREDQLMQRKLRCPGSDSFRSPGMNRCLHMTPEQNSTGKDLLFQQRCIDTQRARSDAVSEGVDIRCRLHRSNSREMYHALQWN